MNYDEKVIKLHKVVDFLSEKIKEVPIVVNRKDRDRWIEELRNMVESD